MARLRVVQVVLSLAPGGTERLVVDIVRRTRARCDSLVCCLDEEGAWAADIAQEGIPVTALKRQPGFQPSLGWHIAAIARAHRAQVLHCHQYSPFIYGRIAAALTGTGIVFTEHGRLSDARPSLKRRLVNPVVGRLGGSIFAVSHHLRRHMIDEGLPASRVAVIHNGIDPGIAPTPHDRAARRQQLELPAVAFVVGTAARLDVVKDLGTLIRAIGSLQRTLASTRLVIFGDGPEHAALSALVSAHGLGGMVTFTGHRQDVRELLAALDVFVNCSTSEGISLTILEAMAAGLPVVATSVGGTPEVVVPETGLLVPARAPEALAAALAELEAMPDRRTSLGQAGRDRVLREFTLDRMVTDYLAEYEHVARRTN